MTELLPCPFCGGEADVIDYDDECWVAHQCANGTAVETDSYETVNEAIAAWNTRAERTCYADEVTHRNCKYSINRGWRERTCEIVEKQEEWQYNFGVKDYEFSCGHTIGWAHTYDPKYCPNCGAKVVGE